MDTAVVPVVEVGELPRERTGHRGGGRLRTGNPGKRSQLVILQDMARTRLRKAIEWAGEIVLHEPKADEKPRYTVEDKARAAEFLRRCTGMDKEHARPPKRTAFAVVRQAAGELARTVEPAPPLPPPPAGDR